MIDRMQKANQTSNLRDYGKAWWDVWNRFWFTPEQPHALAVIRICTGAMLAYTHTVWLSQVTDFMGERAWIDQTTIEQLHENDWAWSWLFGITSPSLLIAHQVILILFSVAMCVGLCTRVIVPIVWWMTLMVCHRMTGALFGLDQILVMLTFALMWSNCGAVFSLDSRRTRNSAKSEQWQGIGLWLFPADAPSLANRIATRFIQLHLCIIYLFGGLSKLRGEMWWDGSALWYTAVNFEYQSLDITWLGHFRFVIATLTTITIFWETFYCALVWPKLTRPIALGMALLVHGGIALALGMITFGSIMIVANLAFIPPPVFVRVATWMSPKK